MSSRPDPPLEKEVFLVNSSGGVWYNPTSGMPMSTPGGGNTKFEVFPAPEYFRRPDVFGLMTKGQDGRTLFLTAEVTNTNVSLKRKLTNYSFFMLGDHGLLLPFSDLGLYWIKGDNNTGTLVPTPLLKTTEPDQRAIYLKVI